MTTVIHVVSPLMETKNKKSYFKYFVSLTGYHLFSKGIVHCQLYFSFAIPCIRDNLIFPTFSIIFKSTTMYIASETFTTRLTTTPSRRKSLDRKKRSDLRMKSLKTKSKNARKEW